MSENHFKTLAAIDVSKHIEKKSNMSYLSWSWAVDHLMRQDPTAYWTFHAPQAFGETLMVSCDVVAFGKSITMHLPVMDHRNKAIKGPDAFEVNKAMMRCLTKAIACHGLGLYIYAGEDIPSAYDKAAPEVVTITAQQAAEIEQFVAALSMDIQKINSAFGLRSIDELPADRYQSVIKRLTDIKAEKARGACDGNA